MNHLRAITVIALIPLVLLTVPRAAHPAWAQTAAVDVQSATQLQLPDSAFPSDYTSAGSLAMAAADADNTDFSFFHVRSYSALGMRGGWSQVGHAGTFREDNPFPPLLTVAYIGIRLAYMGTYYADEVAARNAFADITTNPQITTWQLCTQGEQCLQTGYGVNVLGVQTLYGRVRVIQQGNVLVEILSDVLTDNFPLDPATDSLEPVGERSEPDVPVAQRGLRRGGVEAGVDERPAVRALDEVDVHDPEGEGEGQGDPAHAGRDLRRGAHQTHSGCSLLPASSACRGPAARLR